MNRQSRNFSPESCKGAVTDLSITSSGIWLSLSNRTTPPSLPPSLPSSSPSSLLFCKTVPKNTSHPFPKPFFYSPGICILLKKKKKRETYPVQLCSLNVCCETCYARWYLYSSACVLPSSLSCRLHIDWSKQGKRGKKREVKEEKQLDLESWLQISMLCALQEINT